MQNIIFNLPYRIIFGDNGFSELLAECKLLNKRRLFILTISPLEKLIIDNFSELTSKGVQIHIDTTIINEPTTSDFNRLLLEARKFKADGIIGIGGGSVLDVAKLIAVMLTDTTDFSKYVGIDLIPRRDTWLACLPTTAGTGSEVSQNSILMDDSDGGSKKGIISRWLVPDLAIIDPTLTKGVPPHITAFTGIDALTHCLEAYINKFSHPIVDLYALEGITLIAKSLKRVYDNGNDTEARSDVALGSLYGGMCLGPVNTAAVHALAYPLGSFFGVAHGLSNAVLLPSVMRFNIPQAVEVYANIGRKLGADISLTDEDAAYFGVEIIEKLISDCDIKCNINQFGIEEKDIELLSIEALKVQRLLKNNPREVTYEDAYSIYSSLI